MATVRAPGPDRSGSPLDDGGSPGIGTSIYNVLLGVYPTAFRERYRDEMVVLFGDQLRDARAGRANGGVAVIWIRSLIDLAASAIGEHMRRDRTVAASVASFEPTRSMRLLGLLGLVGAVLLLWAFISLNPFADPALNRIRLVVFAFAGVAVSVAFYPRQAQAAPALARLTTGAVVIAGLWYATTVVLSVGVDNPFLGTFGFMQMLANVALWVSPAAWAIGMLHTGAAWRGMPRRLELLTKAGLWLLMGSIVGWLGDDRLGLVDSLWGDMWQMVALAGVAMNGLGWALVGAVLLLGGRGGRPGRD